MTDTDRMTGIFTHVTHRLPFHSLLDRSGTGRKKTELWPFSWGFPSKAWPCPPCVSDVIQATLLTCLSPGNAREGWVLCSQPLESTYRYPSLPSPSARALDFGYLTQDMIDDYEPALMFTIPRLAIVW